MTSWIFVSSAFSACCIGFWETRKPAMPMEEITIIETIIAIACFLFPAVEFKGRVNNSPQDD